MGLFPRLCCAAQVHSIVSKLMMDEKLHGSWDQPTSTIVMHNAEPSRLQSLAMQFADKAATIVDLNERALTLRTGGLRDGEDDVGRGYQEGGGSRRYACAVHAVVRHRTAHRASQTETQKGLRYGERALVH